MSEVRIWEEIERSLRPGRCGPIPNAGIPGNGASRQSAKLQIHAAVRIPIALFRPEIEDLLANFRSALRPPL